MIKKKSLYQFHIFYLLILFCCVSVSCKQDDVYLYDKTGFEPKRTYYAPPPKYAPYSRPSSRGYRNPYNQPPRNYSPYYDSDFYYVPPGYYGDYYDNNGQIDQHIDPNEKY